MNKIIKSRTSIILISLILSYFITEVYQNILGFILILSVGLIHGANDLLIIKNFTIKESNNSQISYFFYYLSIVFLGLIFFYILPSVALLTFVIVSIYHFGEQHWEVTLANTSISRFKKIFLMTFHGLIFFIIIFMNNIISVNEVLNSFNIPPLYYSYLIITLSSSLIIYVLFLIYLNELREYFINEIIFLILFFLLTINSTLIYGFAIYFIFFHSLLSIKDQVKFIYGNDKSESIKKYITSSLPYFILALTSLLIFYLVVDLQEINLLPIIFTFLAAITFPHVIVIEKMYRLKK
tara:strand:- start:235 stop:1119 length:885 start_codon:yes stop_codon:yes gene_type:complete